MCLMIYVIPFDYQGCHVCLLVFFGGGEVFPSLSHVFPRTVSFTSVGILGYQFRGGRI